MNSTERLCLGCMTDNGGEKICSICGYNKSEKNPSDALPTSFWINDRYLVGKYISSNGEGISYIGWDNAEESIINIREYFPTDNAKRNPDKTISIIKGCEYHFNEGLLDFIEIAKTLMSIQNPSLVAPSAVFEENGTAYAVYKSITAITLREFLTRNGGTLKWEQAKPLFIPLIDAVKALNDSGILHRGISPETVLVGRDGKLHLGGVCVKGARRKNSGFNAQLYSGYAAIEQYGIEEMHDDKYTDVYGLCATLFRTLIGTVPPEATARFEKDSMTIPAKAAEELPHSVLSALANGLQVIPADRTPNMEQLRKEFVDGEIATVQVEKKTVAAAKKAESKTDKNKAKKSGSSAKYAVIAAVVTAVVFTGIVATLALTLFKDELFPSKEPTDTSSVEDTFETPSVDAIGSVDSDVEDDVKLYSAPNVLGMYFAELADLEDYSKFEFVISGKDYSDKYARGTILSQSVEAGTGVEKGSKIEVVISLGAEKVAIANVVGLDEMSAKMELLKQGFLYENIEVIEKYDEEKTPGVIIEQEPAYGSSISLEDVIVLYINSYKGDSEETYN